MAIRNSSKGPMAKMSRFLGRSRAPRMTFPKTGSPQDGPRRNPKSAQEGPRGIQDSPRGLQDAQDGLKTAKYALTAAQEVRKTASRAPPSKPQEASHILRYPITNSTLHPKQRGRVTTPTGKTWRLVGQTTAMKLDRETSTARKSIGEPPI